MRAAGAAGRGGGAGAGELAGLGDQAAGRVPDLGLLVEPAALPELAAHHAGQPARGRDAAQVDGQLDRGRPAGQAELEAARGERVDHLEQGQRVDGTAVGKPDPAAHVQAPARAAGDPSGGGRVESQVQVLEQVGPLAAGHLGPPRDAVLHRRQPGRAAGPLPAGRRPGVDPSGGDQSLQPGLAPLEQGHPRRRQAAAGPQPVRLELDRAGVGRGQEVGADHQRMGLPGRLHPGPRDQGQQVPTVGPAGHRPARVDRGRPALRAALHRRGQIERMPAGRPGPVPVSRHAASSVRPGGCQRARHTGKPAARQRLQSARISSTVRFAGATNPGFVSR
jgi:hypothetical protein